MKKPGNGAICKGGYEKISPLGNYFLLEASMNIIYCCRGSYVKCQIHHVIQHCMQRLHESVDGNDAMIICM